MPPMAPFAEFDAPAPPTEPVSALDFIKDAASPHVAHLLVASWDNFVRLYDLSSCAEGADKVRVLQSFEHPAAVLDVCWLTDSMAASACLDRRVRLLNVENGQMRLLGKHEAGVSRVCYDADSGLLFSGSWDATLHIWDPHTDGDALRCTLHMPGKVFAMDVAPATAHTHPRLVVAMAGRAVYVYDTRRVRTALDRGDDNLQPEQKRESSLKYMLRDVRCMPDGQGFASSSVEGRVAVEFFDTSPEAQAQKYAFKCHRREVDGTDIVYPIHTLAFHPVYGTFASGGGDAHCALWDAVAKKRIRQYVLPSAVSAVAFNADGSLMAIASGAENLEEGTEAHHGPIALHVKYATEDAKPKVK